MTTPRGDDDSQGNRDQPTEYIRPPETGHPGYTSDPTRAYGQQYPGQQYPSQQYPGQQGYHPTEALPAGDYYNRQQPQYGEAPFLDQNGGGPGKGPRSKTPLVVLAALLVIAVVGFGAYLVNDSQSTSRTAAPAITPRSVAPTTTAPTTTAPSPSGSLPGLEGIPGGVGEALGSQGASIGTIVSNDGTTIVMDGIGGSSVTVVTNAQTQIVALGASSVADLQPGTSIVVQGTPLAEGSITAEVIVSTGIGFN